MQHYCAPMCRLCRRLGARMCAASARAEAEERHFEERDAIADAFLHRPRSEPETFVRNTYTDAWRVEHWADPAYELGRRVAS